MLKHISHVLVSRYSQPKVQTKRTRRTTKGGAGIKYWCSTWVPLLTVLDSGLITGGNVAGYNYEAELHCTMEHGELSMKFTMSNWTMVVHKWYRSEFEVLNACIKTLAVTCEGLDRSCGDSWMAAASMAFLDRAQDVACLVMVGLGEVDLKDVRLVSLLNWVIYLELSAMSEIAKS